MARKKGTRDRKKKTVSRDLKSINVDDMTYRELQDYAKNIEDEKGVEINKSAKKNELLESIKAHMGEAAGPGEKKIEVSDAVSEVIGKKEAEIPEKIMSKKYNKLLLNWTADGYDVDALEELLKSGDEKRIRSEFKEFEGAVGKIEGIKKALDRMNKTGLAGDVDSLTDLLVDPKHYKEAGAKFELLKKKRRALDLKAELDKMVLPKMKDRVAELKARLDNLGEIERVEKDIEQLKVEYKESYFVEGIVSEVKAPEKKPPTAAPPTEPRKAVVKSKVGPMMVKDIFLLYKDGRFISHHTSRPVSKEEQTQLFADLKVGRNYLRSPKYVPHKLNAIKAEKRHIIVQSGNFTVVIMIAEGDVNPWTERIVTKVLTLMEKEDVANLRDWNGDVSTLKSSGKYMQALLFACMKLAKKKA
jgi:hypothetical protein